MSLSLRHLSPPRVIIGSEDVTPYLGDGSTWSNVDPGGFEACSLTFPKDMDSTIRGLPIVIMSGLSTVWMGRVQQVQRSLGHNTIVMGEGYGALFKDQSGSMVFVDRDLTKWGDPSYTRQAALVTANFQLASSQVAADPTSNSPALVQSITDSWVAPQEPINESWYDAGPGNLISSIHYALSLSQSGGAWTATLTLATDANLSGGSTSANLGGVPSSSGYYAPGTPQRFANLDHYFASTPAGGAGSIFNAYWQNLAVYGNHGLTGRGSDPVGYYPSDIFGWVLSQIAGLQAGTIQQTDASDFILPHSVYYTPVTLDAIVSDMATAQGWHWGSWEPPTITGDQRPRGDFRPRPAAGAFTAFCRRSDCGTLDIREDLTQQFDTAVVNFSQVDGTQGAVTVTTDNAVLDAAGIPSRTVIFQGGTMTPATAAVFAAEALAITNAQARVAGTAEIISAIDGGTRPAWNLKAGIDRLRIGDAPSNDAWGAQSDYPITRVETSISSGGFTTSVEIGSGANLIETLQARLAAATALAGQGS